MDPNTDSQIEEQPAASPALEHAEEAHAEMAPVAAADPAPVSATPASVAAPVTDPGEPDEIEETEPLTIERVVQLLERRRIGKLGKSIHTTELPATPDFGVSVQQTAAGFQVIVRGKRYAICHAVCENVIRALRRVLKPSDGIQFHPPVAPAAVTPEGDGAAPIEPVQVDPRPRFEINFIAL